MGLTTKHEQARTPGAVVRPVRAEDAEAIHEMRRQPGVMASAATFPSERLADQRRFIEGFGPDDHVMAAEVDGRVVGIAGLHIKRGRRRHLGDVDVIVHDDFQGRGIGGALLAALLDLADNHLGLIRVELEVFPDNDRAIRLYEGLGFEHEGRKRKAVLVHGEYADLLVMGRTR